MVTSGKEAWRPLYPFKDRYFDRAGLKMHFVDEGKGEPVLMVHGNPTWSFYYRELIRDLAKDHRVIAPDHIGMGLSDKPGEDRYNFTLQSRVDDLDALVESLNPQGKINLIVHDWGGMIGLAWACRHPERIRRLVVSNTWAFDWPKGAEPPWQLKLARGPLGSLLVRGLNAFSIGTVLTCANKLSADSQAKAGYIQPYSNWADRLAVLRFVQDIPEGPGAPAYELMKRTGDDLHKLSEVPAMIIWGGRDFVFNKVFFEEWKRRFPKAEVLDLPDARHLVLEDAAERVVPAVRAFLSR
jgi:haloalkane dehalogenase